MTVSRLLSKEFVVLPLHAQDAESVLRELLSTLKDAGIIDSPDHCLQTILKRERRMSTAVGKGIALPHGLSNEIDEVQVVLGISIDGIEFRAVDNLLCHIFILLVSPESQPEKHLKLLSRFTKLLRDGVLRSALMEARTPDQVLELLTERENLADDDSL